MSRFDAIVVGARVAGASTALLLARKGYRVLLVDRATFPSDTMSTHLIHVAGMDRLHRWGLAADVIATGCPPVPTYHLDLGPFAIAARPRGARNAPVAYAPRRYLLDTILVEAAAAAGVEVREGFSLRSVIADEGTVVGIRGSAKGGPEVRELAPIVVGADGVGSRLARTVEAEITHQQPTYAAIYYSYWSGFPTDGEFQLYQRGARGFATIPTNDGLTVVAVAWPAEEFTANRGDLLGNYLRAFEIDPALADRAHGATRETRLVGARMENFYRRSHGPGWALVGDAGYHKDATTAQGITDAFRDAELLADAIDDGHRGHRSMDEALAGYEHSRDRTSRPMFDLSCSFASFDPPAAEEQELFALIASREDAAEDFMSVLAGTMPVGSFFDPSNLARYADDIHARA